MILLKVCLFRNWLNDDSFKRNLINQIEHELFNIFIGKKKNATQAINSMVIEW